MSKSIPTSITTTTPSEISISTASTTTLPSIEYKPESSTNNTSLLVGISSALVFFLLVIIGAFVFKTLKAKKNKINIDDSETRSDGYELNNF